jgi:cytochrome c oxidase assembly factor CtaG
LLTGLITPTILYLRGAMGYRVERWRKAAFLAAMASLFMALISPLDAASEALFSAHMIQHLLLILAAAPLLMWSRPLAPLLRGLPHAWRKAVGSAAHHPILQGMWAKMSGAMTVLVLHIVALWLWHLPTLYSAALADKGVHILEHASFFTTASLYWWMILNRDQVGGRVLSVFVVMMASGLLGALMTFAGAPWYGDHMLLAAAWGLTPLEDQQIAGLLMWIPAGILYASIAAALLGTWLNSLEQRMLRRQRILYKEGGKELGDA